MRTRPSATRIVWCPITHWILCGALALVVAIVSGCGGKTAGQQPAQVRANGAPASAQPEASASASDSALPRRAGGDAPDTGHADAAGHTETVGDRASSSGKTGETAASISGVLYWTDPMVPGSHFDHPGKSPFMDMSLVPIYASDPRIVHVSAEEQRRLGLITASAGLRDHWYGVISTEGDITYDERNVRDITIRVNARVSKFYPFHKGLVIKKGRPLYELSSPEVYTDLLHFLTLHQNAGKINAVSVDNVHIVQQSHTTLRWRGIPEATIQHVLETGKATDHFLVRAPITGLVLTRNAVQGTLINAGVRTGQFTTYGEVVAKLADISFVYAEAKLWGDQMDYVKPGMTAKVRPEGSNDWYVAKVTYVYPTLKPGKRFGIARIALNNPHYRLKPGMFATIRIQVPEAKDVVVVPRAAVTYLPSGQFVYVRVDGTHFERRKVQVSAPVDGDVPVVRGLRKGEQVVTSGSFFLNADRELRRG